MEKLRGAWAAVVGAMIVSLLHFGMGGNNLGLSLIAAASEAAFLFVIVWRSWVRDELQQRAGVLVCFGALFGVLVVAVVLPLMAEPAPRWLHD